MDQTAAQAVPVQLPQNEEVTMGVNCESCRYRYWLARYGCYVHGEDCDKYGTDLCKKMNDPDFIAYMKARERCGE